MPSVFDGADLNFVAKVRAGFVPHSRNEVFRRLKRLETDKCSFANLPEKRRNLGAHCRGDEKLSVARAATSGSDKLSRMDARWLFETLEVRGIA